MMRGRFSSVAAGISLMAAALSLLVPQTGVAQQALTEGEALVQQRDYAERVCPAEFAAALPRGDLDVWSLPEPYASRVLNDEMLEILAAPNGIHFLTSSTQGRAVDTAAYLLKNAAARKDLTADLYQGFANTMAKQLVLFECLWPEDADFSHVPGLPAQLVPVLPELRDCILQSVRGFIDLAADGLSGPELAAAVEAVDKAEVPSCLTVARAMT